MKRRIVAVVLSLALCMGGTLEAGAAALGTPEVQAVVETESGSAGDSFSDEAEQQPQPDEISGGNTGDEVTPEITETPTEMPEITETPDIIETPDITETPDIDQTDDFNAGDAEELQIASADGKDQKTVDNGNADSASSTGAVVVNGVVKATIGDWTSDDLGYRLRKKKVSDDMVPEGKTSTDSTEAQDTAQQEIETETLEAGETQDSAADTEVSVGEDEQSEADVQTDDTSVSEADVQANDASEAGAGSVEDEYFTAQDGLLQINTNGHTGYYLFNEDGYLVTGRMSREPGTAGYTGTKKVEWYFMDGDKATLYSDSQSKAITPWTSNMGQQQKNYWLWTGSTFRYYADKTGDFTSVTDLKITGKLQKIGDDYYTLAKSGKPYTGIRKLKAGTETFEYYFQPTKGTDGIPGKLFHNGWMYYKNSKGVKRFIYCSPKTATIGQVMKHGIYVSKVMSKTNTFLLNSQGYVLTNTMGKAQNDAYYITDEKGHIIKSKLVKYGRYRYYFGGNGKRVTWTNSWRKCAGASNRYYYFGNVAGRVVEKTGWQKVTRTTGKYWGWLYFDKNGNHYKDQMITVKSSKKTYYFTSSGKVASGITTINNKNYFFATSNSKTHRGWMYKNTLIRYKNNWYYADSKGVLKKNGWQKVGKYWYYLKDYKVLTNQAIKRGKVNGRLDNQGRFTTGWVVISDYNNKVKYINPSTGKDYVKNTSCWIDGKLYYFDKNGYRRNDISGS